jgi:membrane-associated protein
MGDFFAVLWVVLKGLVANWNKPDQWGQFLNQPEAYWSIVAALAIVIFSETGLLVGFFLPGDSLLVSVGIVARLAGMDIVPLMLVLCVAAVVGDTVGYWVGAKAGPAIFNRPNSRWFKRDHLLAAKAFFDKHGGKTIIYARFMPFARTFAPVVAGAAKMEYRHFLAYNVIGGVAWIVSMLLFGYTAQDWLEPALKAVFGPGFQLVKNIDILAGVIILLSLAPMVVLKLLQRRAKKQAERAAGQAPDMMMSVPVSTPKV